MTIVTIESMLNIMRLAAVATTDELAKKFLLQSLGEQEDKAALELSETCWGEVFDALDVNNRCEQIRSALKEVQQYQGEGL